MSTHHINNQAQPIVSIIIVTYNADKYIKGCLDAIVQQSFKQYEIVVKDGGSTDQTLQMLNDYKAHIAWIGSEADKGIYDAMNQAVKHARGKWIYFLGADDRLLDGFSEFCSHLKQEDTLYYGDCMTDNGVFGGKYSAYKAAKYSICQQAIFYPATVFKKYSYNTRYKVYADYALNLQCWGDRSFIKKYIPVAVAHYCLEGFSSVAHDEEFKRDKPGIIRESMGWLMYLRFLYKRRKEQRRPGSNFF